MFSRNVTVTCILASRSKEVATAAIAVPAVVLVAAAEATVAVVALADQQVAFREEDTALPDEKSDNQTK